MLGRVGAAVSLVGARAAGRGVQAACGVSIAAGRARATRVAARAASTAADKDKVVVTACLNGVLTDPKMFPDCVIPVTPEEMATAAAEVWDAGATIVHIHMRDQRPGKGHMPTWDPDVCEDIVSAIRARCPEMLVNLTTGTIGSEGPIGGGPLGPIDGPVACINRVKPEMAALNSGSLNYLKAKRDGTWAWPPMMFDNPVSKVEKMAEAMRAVGTTPECECFDTGIVRSVRMFEHVGMMTQPIHVSLVMGVASGMPAKASWLPLLVEEMNPESQWQVIAIGREEVWDLHRRCIELGGNARTGMEDTFYKPDGSRARNSGELITEMVKLIREVGREPASAAETRARVLHR